MSHLSLVLSEGKDKEEQEKAKEKKLSCMRYRFTCVTDFVEPGKNVEPSSCSKIYESETSHKSQNSEIPEPPDHPPLSTAIINEKKIRHMVPLDAITNETSELLEPDNHPPLSSAIMDQKGSINMLPSYKITKTTSCAKTSDSESELDSYYLDSTTTSLSSSNVPSSSYERDLKKAKSKEPSKPALK